MMGPEDHDGRILRTQGLDRPPGLPGDLVETHHLRTKGRFPLSEELRVAEVDRRVKRELSRELRSDPPHHRHGPEVPLHSAFVDDDDRGTIRVGEVPTERVELCEGSVTAPRSPRPPGLPGERHGEDQRQDRDDGDHDGGHAPEPSAHPDDRSHETERAEDRDRQREGHGAWQRHRATGERGERRHHRDESPGDEEPRGAPTRLLLRTGHQPRAADHGGGRGRGQTISGELRRQVSLHGTARETDRVRAGSRASRAGARRSRGRCRRRRSSPRVPTRSRRARVPAGDRGATPAGTRAPRSPGAP